MHEYSLVKALLRQVDEIARRENAVCVESVHVTIGMFSGVEVELLKMAFDDLVRQSSLGTAKLVIAEVALEARCEKCFTEFLVERFRFVCPECTGRKVDIVRGEEMMLEQVVLES